MPQKIARAWRVLLHNCYTARPRGTQSIFRQPPTSPRRARCPHRPASSRVQRISMAAFAVGAACMAARAAPPRRMHHRRPHPGRRGALIGSPVESTTRFRAAIQAAPTRCRASSVGADAHIGPPGSVCKAVRRPKASPWRPRGPQGSAASGRYSDRSGQAEGLTEGISAGRDWELTIPQSRCASQLPLHKGACPLRHREADSGRRRCGGCDSRPRTRHARPYGVRRGCGGNWGPARAAIQAAPTDAPPIRFVGRGAHTPPNQAAGIAGLASIAAAAGPLVGAGFMPARAAPPGATGPRS